MKFQSEFKYFHSRKCTWTCRLRNGVHFVSASMCYEPPYHPIIQNTGSIIVKHKSFRYELQSSRYVTWIFQICNIFIVEKSHRLMYMCYTVSYCSIDVFFDNVKQHSLSCHIMPLHASSIHLIARWFLTQPWQSCWCEQIVQICNLNRPDM